MLGLSLKSLKRLLRYWEKGFSFVLNNQPQGMLNSHVGVRFLLSMAPLGSPSPLGIITQPDSGGESLLIGTPMLSSSFRPSIVVIIGVLITMFSLTFFLLLYVKRCKQFILVGEGGEISQEPEATPPFPRTYSSIDRLLIEAFPMLSFASLPLSNSGVDRLLVEALPMFTFASLQGIKEGLECAVCLCQFEDNDILRLLPKCQHAFHVDCVDLWLASHSTCPLCRHCVSQEDLILVEKSVSSRHSLEALQQELAPIVAPPPLNSALLGTLSSKEVEAPIQVIVPAENPDAAVVMPLKPETTTRRDGLLLDDPLVDRITDSAKTFVPCRRFAHRIVISDVFMRERWSDFAAKDVLFLNTQLLFGLNDRLSVSRMSSCSRKSFVSPLNLQTISPCRPDFILTDGRRFSSSSANRKEVLSSPSRVGKDFGQMNVNVQSSGVAKKLSPHTPRDATTMASMGATMGLEPSCQSTSQLPGITDRPPLPLGVKPKYDFEGKGAQFFNRAFSLGRMSSLDLDERLHMGSCQTSLSVLGTTVEQIAPSGGRKDFVGSKFPEAQQTVISEKTRKWLSIARKTLNQLLGHEKRIVPSNVVIGPKI